MSQPPTPMPEPVCAFGECAAPAPYGFSPPGGSAIERYTRAIFTCALHREHGEALLQAEDRRRCSEPGGRAGDDGPAGGGQAAVIPLRSEELRATRRPTRPALRYHGGKWKLADWIIAHLPPHRIYVEPFGGAASVLLKKQPARAEVYNDLDGEVVNLFRILRDPALAHELRRRVELTPFARAEFKAAYRLCAEHDVAPAIPEAPCVECARRMITRSFQGFGSAAMTRTHVTGFRKNSNRSGTTPAQDWRNWPDHVPALVNRLRGVIIENKPAIEVIADHDRHDALHLIDPPYPWSTRSSMTDRKKIGVKHAYRHEMTDQDHISLADTLHGGGERDGGALRLSLRPLRQAALSRLGAFRDRRACRRRARTHRSALAQSRGLGGAEEREAAVA